VALLLVRGHQTVSTTPDQQGMVSQFRAAIAYTRRQPFLLLVIAISGLVGALGNPIFGFTVVFAGVVYLVGPAALGLLNVAPGVGAIAAVPFLTRRTGSRVLSRTVAFALPMYALAIIVFGAWPAYVVGMVALVVIGASFLAVISSVNSSLQLHVNDDFRGRVMALRLMAFTLSVSVGGLVQGWIADRVGARPTVVGAGVVLLVIAVLLVRSRGTYRLSLLDGPRTEVSTAA
jgi:predicted MFS family arabinose efflux permease